MIRKLTLSFLISLIIFINSTLAMTNEEDLVLNYNKRIIDNYLSLYRISENFISHAESYCSKKIEINELRKIYLKILGKWTKLQHVRFGPVNDFNNYSKIQFWPDKRGVIGRQFSRALKSKSNEYEDPGSLGSKSVAVQGLPILEIILFDNIENNKELSNYKFKCNYMLAIIKNLNFIFGYTYNIWISDREIFEYVEKKNFFPEYFNSILSQLEFIHNYKIYDFKNKNINYKKLEYWRSSYSLQSIKNNLEEIYYLYNFLILPKLKEKNSKNIILVENLFSKIFYRLKAIDEPLYLYIDNVENQKDLNLLRSKIKILHTTLQNDVSEELSIQIGFNKMDGD